MRESDIKPHAETYAAEFGPRHLANHWPMVQTALTGLGAPESAFQAFDEEYRPKLDMLEGEEAEHINAGNFDAWLGQGKNYQGYYSWFADRLTKDGVQATVGNALAHLAPGLPTGAFHAVIRLACGLEAEDRSEIAAGLAYLADHYMDSAPLMWQRDVEGQPFAASLKRLAYKINKGELTAPKRTGQNTITDRMRDVIADPALAAALQEQNLPDYGGLKGLSETVLAMFLCSRDFTLLHGITTSHALWVISQHVDPDIARRLTDWFALSLVIAWVSLGAEDPGDDMMEIPFEFVDEDQMKARAWANNNDHDIKLTWSCFELERIYEQPLYRQAIRLWLNI